MLWTTTYSWVDSGVRVSIDYQESGQDKFSYQKLASIVFNVSQYLFQKVLVKWTAPARASNLSLAVKYEKLDYIIQDNVSELYTKCNK